MHNLLFHTFYKHGFTKKNTIFVIVGDHGQVFGKNKRYFHGATDEESIHVMGMRIVPFC